MKVKELIHYLEKENPDAPVVFTENCSFNDILFNGQDQDEIHYQMEYEGLTKEQALKEVRVELCEDQSYIIEKEWKKKEEEWKESDNER